MELLDILSRLSNGNRLTSEELQALLKIELANANAFEIAKVNGLEKIQERTERFCQLYPQVKQLCQREGFQSDDAIRLAFWRLWLPLALQLAQVRENLGRPSIQGILGGQGTGKTTLTKVLCLILEHLDYRGIGVSIDDLYKTYTERKELRKRDPRLIKRGPPGTHDVDLGIELLDRVLQARTPIFIPRFDKSLHSGEGDRIQSEKVDKVDILLFEGWFVGVQPVNSEMIDNASIIAPEDRQFAKDTNERLKAYLPLWERLDRLMVLYPIDYRLGMEWRKEAERTLRERTGYGMSNAEIEKFVKYFWKALHPELFITPLSQKADLVVEINENHSLGRIYRPV